MYQQITPAGTEMIIDVMYCIAPSDIPFRPGAGHRKTVAFGMEKKYNETVSRNQWAQQGVSHDRSPLECLVSGRNAAMAPVTGYCAAALDLYSNIN